MNGVKLGNLIERYVNVDIHPDRTDPLLGRGIRTQILGPDGAEPGTPNPDVKELSWTRPGQRPFVYQMAANVNLTATVAPQPIMPTSFASDGVVISVPSGGNPVFFGFGSGIGPTSGIQVAANQPILFAPENNRELWEIQRVLEALYGLLSQGQSLPQFKSPRVVMDLNQWYHCCSSGTQAFSAMAIFIPEMQ